MQNYNTPFYYQVEPEQNKSKLLNRNATIPNTVQQQLLQNMAQFGLNKITQIIRDPQNNPQFLPMNQLFVDKDFPPNNKSLYGDKMPEDWKDIKFKGWMRLHQIYKNPKIFLEKIQPMDIKQGALGDCYFLAGLAALAETPKRIANAFITTQINPAHYYVVKILFKGVWREIILDDYVPVALNEEGKVDIAFSSGNGEELWVILLEKAWAKLHGNYAAIEAGFGDQALHDLTGATTETFDTQDEEMTNNQLWTQLIEATEWNFPVVCGSGGETDQQVDQYDVVQGHQFTVMGAYEIEFGNSTRRLVKIRNPWGVGGEQTGMWSDEDSKWDDVDQQTKQQIGYTNDPEDGIFFMEFRHFLKRFADFTIARVYDNSSYVNCISANQNNKGYFLVNIQKEGEYSFTVDQTSARLFKIEQYEYPEIIILIAQARGYQLKYLQGTCKAERSVSITHDLKPGSYIIYAHIIARGANKKNPPERINLASYCQFPCTIQQINKPDHFKTRLFTDHALHHLEKQDIEQIEKGLFSTQKFTDEGYQYFFINNKSKNAYNFYCNLSKNSQKGQKGKKQKKKQKIEQISQAEKFIPCEQIRNQTKWEFLLSPGQSKLLVAGTSISQEQFFMEYEYEQN